MSDPRVPPPGQRRVPPPPPQRRGGRDRAEGPGQRPARDRRAERVPAEVVPGSGDQAPRPRDLETIEAQSTRKRDERHREQEMAADLRRRRRTRMRDEVVATLRTPRARRRAFVMREVLDRPVSLRDRPPGVPPW